MKKAQKIHFEGRGSQFPYNTGTAILFEEGFLVGISEGVVFNGRLLKGGTKIRVGTVCDEYPYEVVEEIEVPQELFKNALAIMQAEFYLSKHLLFL